MAASASTAFAVSTSLDLSSKGAFRSSGSCNVVQGAPMARAAARVGGIRASSKNSEVSARWSKTFVCMLSNERGKSGE